MKKLSEAALNVIRTLHTEKHPKGLCATITVKGEGPNGMLARPLYAEVNKVLTALGGKWNRGAAGHIFPDVDSLDDALDSVVHTGEVVDTKKLFQFYETPPELADALVAAAEIKVGMRVMEPSAGHGALIYAMARAELPPFRLSFVERDSTKGPKIEAAVAALRQVTKVTGEIRALGQDFLTGTDTDGFDRIIMNPPFTKQQDAKHVRHAYDCLKPGGRLVAIMSAAVKFRDTANYQWVREHAAEIIDNPPDAFKASGTAVRTVTVIINKS